MKKIKISLIVVLLITSFFSVFAQEKIIGEWNDNVGSYWQQHIKIVKDNQKIYKISSFQDGSTHKVELIEVEAKNNQKRAFKDKTSQFEEVYIIDKNGNLDMYDKDGYIREAERSY